MRQITINNIFKNIGNIFKYITPVFVALIWSAFVGVYSQILFDLIVPSSLTALIPYAVWGFAAIIFIFTLYISILHLRSSKIYFLPKYSYYWLVNGYELNDTDIIKSIDAISENKRYGNRLSHNEIDEITNYGLENLDGPFTHIEKHDYLENDNSRLFVFKYKSDYITMKLKFAS